MKWQHYSTTKFLYLHTVSSLFTRSYGLLSQQAHKWQEERRLSEPNKSKSLCSLFLLLCTASCFHTFYTWISIAREKDKRKNLIMKAKREKCYKYQMWNWVHCPGVDQTFYVLPEWEISSIVFHCLTCFQVCLWAHLWVWTPTRTSKSEWFCFKYLCLLFASKTDCLFVSSLLVYGEKLGLNFFGCLFHFRVQWRVSNVWQFSR